MNLSGPYRACDWQRKRPRGAPIAFDEAREIVARLSHWRLQDSWFTPSAVGPCVVLVSDSEQTLLGTFGDWRVVAIDSVASSACEALDASDPPPLDAERDRFMEVVFQSLAKNRYRFWLPLAVEDTTCPANAAFRLYLDAFGRRRALTVAAVAARLDAIPHWTLPSHTAAALEAGRCAVATHLIARQSPETVAVHADSWFALTCAHWATWPVAALLLARGVRATHHHFEKAAKAGNERLALDILRLFPELEPYREPLFHTSFVYVLTWRAGRPLRTLLALGAPLDDFAHRYSAVRARNLTRLLDARADCDALCAAWLGGCPGFRGRG
jgi:hypothetical protein